MNLKAAPEGLGLVLQFNLFVLALVVLTSLGVASFIGYHQLADGWRHLLAHGRAVTDMAAESAEYAVYTHDPEALKQQMDHLEKVPELTYAVVSDPARQILAQRGFRGGQPGIGAPPPSRVPLWDILAGNHLDGVIELEADIRGGTADETGPAASGETIGHLRVGLGLAGFREDAIRSLRLAIEVTLAMLGFGMPISLFMTRRVTASLRRLDQAARAIAEGRLEPVCIGGGPEIAGLAVAFNAMTEKLREYRRQTEEHRQTLEQEVENRTEELRATILEAQSLARQVKAANQAKSQFLANVSHELRTPLNAILGLSNLVLKSPLTDKQRRFVGMVHEAGQTLLELISQILDFSRIEAGKLELRPTDFDPCEVVEEVADLFAGQAEAKGLRLGTELGPDLPACVHADRLRFQQVLINLLGNALKFTEAGEITVRAGQAEDFAHTGLLRFEVEDTGIGIAPTDQEHIFTLFSQLDGTSTRKYGGIGLGLAIARQLVEMMGGSIEVSSAPERGSRFSFTLRLEPVGEAAERIPEIPSLVGLCLLVLAEPGRRRDILAAQLQQCRANPTCVDQPAAALAWLERRAAAGQPAAALIVDRDDEPEALQDFMARAEPLSGGALLLLATPSRRRALAEPLSAGRILVLDRPYRRSQLLHELLALKHRQEPEGAASAATEAAEATHRPRMPAFPQPSHVLPSRLDMRALERIRGLQRKGAADLLSRVVHMYLETSPALIGALRTGLEGGDQEAVRNATHSLKSASANLGAIYLAELLQHLGQSVPSPAAGASMLAAIESEYRLVCEELRALCSHVAQKPSGMSA